MTVIYSVIIPAYNEAVWLAKSLPALSAAMAKSDAIGEVIVVDNNSSDRTAEVAREHGARVVFEPHNQISRAATRGPEPLGPLPGLFGCRYHHVLGAIVLRDCQLERWPLLWRRRLGSF